MIRLDLDSDATDLNALPRFQRARFHARRLCTLACCLCVSALAALIAANFSPEFWRILLRSDGAALLLFATCLLSAYRVAHWRVAALRGDRPANPALHTRWHRRAFSALRRASQTVLRRIGADGGMILLQGASAWVALWAIKSVWNLGLSGSSLGSLGNLAGGFVLLIAFGLLVVERYFAGAAEDEWPEAMSIARCARLLVSTLSLSALCVFFSAADRTWPVRLLVAIGLMPALLALELLLRAVLSLFSPRNAHLEPGMSADSLVAGLFRWPLRPLHILQQELQTRFGIDLRQNWAFSFIRRASLPVLVVLIFIAWLVTGIHELSIEQRGIYERFGKPIKVLGPGLHAGLPWPMARVLPVENGVVHELTTAIAGDKEENTAEPEPSTAEGLPPQTANRLWDASHVAEKSQVIASLVGERQSFHIVNMDVRLIYRIALSDEAALAATYNSADVPTLIRSTANRVLVRYFASRTLDGVLGQGRIRLAEDIGKTVQADLDALSSGVEVLSTIIEAIHPPAGAANAYHSVQAAQISAQAIIARERGNAAEQINVAQLKAGMATDKAAAFARETLAAAEAANLRFAAERNAYRSAGKAFLLEQYFSQLSQGLGNAKLVILDHRIGAGVAPTIDLRTFTTPFDSTSRGSQ